MRHHFNRPQPTLLASALAGVLLIAGAAQSVHAQTFDWKKHKGESISFLVNTNTIGNALIKYKGEFEKLTGITVKTDAYSEQQMRQRLVTVMNARSDETDVFMSLTSREGPQFSKAGWYADLNGLIKNSTTPDYNYADLSPAMLSDATYDKNVIGVPLNIEGPVVYYRKDIFDKCAVAYPKTLADMEPTAKKLKACDAAITPWVSRGLKPAVAFTYSVFFHNMGGQYIKDGKSQMCSQPGKDALALYAKLLKDYSVPGVVNYSFHQISSLYREGKAAMAFESSNELPSVMSGDARLKDTGVALLPPGPGGLHPSVIGWTMSISAYSKKKDAAWYFLQWATSPAMQAKLALEGIAPPRASVASGADYKKWMDEQPVRKAWVESLNEIAKTGTSELGYPIVANPASREYIGQMVDEVLLGQKSVDQACADADEQLDALIEKDK